MAILKRTCMALKRTYRLHVSRLLITRMYIAKNVIRLANGTCVDTQQLVPVKRGCEEQHHAGGGQCRWCSTMYNRIMSQTLLHRGV